MGASRDLGDAAVSLRSRVRDLVDPRCAHVDCGESLRGDDLTLPVTVSDEAARVLGRRQVEFHGTCAASSDLLTGDSPWDLDQAAVNRALGLVPPVSASMED
jgi:hypothetical protein